MEGAPMLDTTTFIGLDVHARSIKAVSLDVMTGEVRAATFGYDAGAVAEWVRSVDPRARCVYESGVTGFDLQKRLSAAVYKSFNMCTVDGDTSTNDSIFLLANGASGVEIKTEEDKKAMADLVLAICTDMARRVASDGEGATHLIEVEAYGLPTEHDARLVAKSIAGSMLFKAAVFGRDANWGRIMAAAGYSGADVDPTRADCIIKSAAGEVQVMKDGFGADFSEELAKKVLTEHDITVIVRFYQGDGEAKAWGCDLTYDYVKINGDYRT